MSEVFDIVIVGGGMAGGALACALADADYKIAIIDNQTPQPFSIDDFFDPRVVALSMASREFLSALGVWEIIAAQRISAFEHMQVWDGDGTAQISFDAADVQQSALGYIVENNLVVSALREKLQQQRNVQWLCPDAVVNLHDQNNAESARLILQSGAEVQGKLIVAADGAQSLLRQLSGINTTEWDYGHSAVVATVRTEKSHGAVARQRFMTTGPLAFLPLRENNGDAHWCSVVWSMAPEAAQELLAQSEQEFSAQLARAFEFVLGDVLEVRGRFAFPLRQRHAQAYQRGRVVLIGDAAHTIHPLAGQGVNLGFMDVRVLAEELQCAQEKMLSPADASVLKRYQRRRRGANLTMTATMELFKQLFAQQALPVRWLRNTGMRGIDALPLLKKQIMRHAMGLSS